MSRDLNLEEKPKITIKVKNQLVRFFTKIKKECDTPSLMSTAVAISPEAEKAMEYVSSLANQKITEDALDPASLFDLQMHIINSLELIGDAGEA